jgi:pyrroline-5-carboxylate reductase
MVMPNTAAKISEAMTALSLEHTLSEDEYSTAKQIFESCGKVVEVSEKYFDAVTAISGSGPAYVYMFIDALTQGGLLHGLPKNIARQLATQTVLGAAKMVQETAISPNELKDDVCSPGGTTIEAVYTLETNHFTATVMDAVTACVNKSRKM